MARAEAVIARAIEQKDIHVKEVSEGDCQEVSVPVHVPVQPDVQELRRQINELRRERDLWRVAQTQIPS